MYLPHEITKAHNFHMGNQIELWVYPWHHMGDVTYRMVTQGIITFSSFFLWDKGAGKIHMFTDKGQTVRTQYHSSYNTWEECGKALEKLFGIYEVVGQ